MTQMDLDDIDLRLLHALQVEPRASWTSLGPVIGADASTLARRWSRLEAAGVSWISGSMRGSQAAIVEITVASGLIDQVVATLTADSRIVMLDFTSGSRNLIALISTRDLDTLADFALHVLAAVPGTQNVHLHPITDVYVDGARWRLRALSEAEVARIPRPAAPRPRAPRRVDPDLRDLIARETWIDGRVSVKAIADGHGISAQRVSDAIAVLRESKMLSFRTDIARAYTDWPVSTWFFIEGPAQVVQAAHQLLRQVPEIRLAVATASRSNLVVLAWLKSLADIGRLEAVLERSLPGARITDRSPVLRALKHLGRRISDDTRVLDGAPAARPED